MSDRTGRRDNDDAPTLPSRSKDDEDLGWGDTRDPERDGERDAEWYRRERPPHHDRD